MTKCVFSIILAMLLAISFSVCGAKYNSFSPEQQKAIYNSISFIKNSSYSSKDRIDTNIVKIQSADDIKSIWNIDNQVDDHSFDSEDWVITIGNTSNHDFAIIVCDSETSKVIGHIPVD